MATYSNNLQFLKIMNFPLDQGFAQLYSLFDNGSSVSDSTFPSHIIMEVVVQDTSQEMVELGYIPQQGYFAVRAEQLFIGGINKITGNGTTSQYHQCNSTNSGAMDFIKSSENFALPPTDTGFTQDLGWDVSEGSSDGYWAPRNEHPLVINYVDDGLFGQEGSPGIIFRPAPQISNVVNDDGEINDYNTKTSWNYINRIMIFNRASGLSTINDLATPGLGGSAYTQAPYASGTFYNESVVDILNTPEEHRVGIIIEMNPDFILSGTSTTNPENWNPKIDLDGWTRWIEY